MREVLASRHLQHIITRDAQPSTAVSGETPCPLGPDQPKTISSGGKPRINTDAMCCTINGEQQPGLPVTLGTFELDAIYFSQVPELKVRRSSRPMPGTLPGKAEMPRGF